MTLSFRIPVLAFLSLLVLAAPAQAVSDKYRNLSARLVTDAEQKLLQLDVMAADELLNLALAADPGNARAFVLKGKAQTRLGNADEGYRLVTVGLDIEPSDQEGLQLKGQYAAALGKVDEAEKALSLLRSVCDAPCEAAEDLSVLIEKARDAQKD